MITISEYLLIRLKELGIQQIFGVPGDYNLGFLDYVVKEEGLTWAGNCNELNASYAADAYARVKGAAAIVTTFGVGELSAMNGIAGSYAEFVPVVHIVGMPALTIQAKKALVHHTLGTGDFEVFAKMSKLVTEEQIILTDKHSMAELDRVLRRCWLKKRPVYIGIPTDVCDIKVEKPHKILNLQYPPSNKESIEEICARVSGMIKNSKAPIILADVCVIRHGMGEVINKLLDETKIPFVTMCMGKGIINETHPQFLGHYAGKLSTPEIKKRVEESDCTICFGTVFADLNTGGFTVHMKASATVEIHSYYTKVKHAIYEDVIFKDLIPALIEKLNGYQYQEEIKKDKLEEFKPKPQAITQDRFWLCMSEFIKEKSIIISETGTSAFGAVLQMPIPKGVNFINQLLWASIGYSVGALFGASIAADRDQEVVAFIGDGSFQLTAQEISSVMRHKLKPIIFLINNDGYTIERAIHGPNMPYNDIQMWKYEKLPASFGDDYWHVRVETEIELNEALLELRQHADKMRFVEVVMDRLDYPSSMRRMFES